MSIHNRKAALPYLEALTATDELQSPSLGFIRPDDYKGGTTSAVAQSKQLNTVICLLVDLSTQVEALSAKVRSLEEVCRNLKERDSEELIKRLEGLKLGGGSTSRVPEPRGQLRVFTDPRTLVARARGRGR